MAIQISISNAIGSRGRGNIVPPLDPDAQAFITAASITDPTQQSAINTLVVDLKGYNIWTKFKAIYPIVGGTASSHKWNLKDPRDLDAAYRLTFATGWTHSSTGMTPLNAYADTSFNVNTYRYDNHISYYSRTNIDEVTNELGAANISSSESFSIGARISNIAYFGNHLTSAQITFANTDSRGLFLNSRTANNLYKAYKNGSLQLNSTVLTGANINYNMYLGARNVANTPTFYTTKQCAFASIGDGLTDTEAAQFATTVEKYQTTLGRSMNPWYDNGTLLLDTYQNSSAAYSLRKLRNFYIGAAIRVRRSSDNAEQDIYFNSTGNLDTASLLTFVGAGSGFVTTFYDQSGNSKDVTQSTGVNQPRIVIGGALVTNPTNGKPCLNYTTAVGAQNWLQLTNQTFNGDNTLFGVYNWNSGDSGILSYGQASSGKRRAIFVFSPTGSAPWYSYASGFAQNLQIAAAATSTNYVTYSLFNTTSQQIEGSVNGGSVQSASRTLSNSAAAPLYLGRTESGEYLDGNIFEAIFYNSNQSTNRAGIRDNINSFYTIY